MLRALLWSRRNQASSPGRADVKRNMSLCLFILENRKPCPNFCNRWTSRLGLSDNGIINFVDPDVLGGKKPMEPSNWIRHCRCQTMILLTDADDAVAQFLPFIFSLFLCVANVDLLAFFYLPLFIRNMKRVDAKSKDILAPNSIWSLDLEKDNWEESVR